MKFGKITIIGSGRVGTSTAFGLICQNIAKEVSLLDINEDVLEAECIDLRDAKYFSFTGHVHKGNWEEAKNSQIIVICAGEVLRPESSLHQVVNANKRIFDDIFSRLGQLHQKCVVIVATSPVDAMTQYAQKLSGLPKNQVFGTGTLLDTQRLRVKLGKKFQINEKSVHAYVMGEKGDTAFVPWSHATIAGRKLTEFFSEDPESQSRVLDTFVNKIKIKTDRVLTSKYGTNFGIAACIAAICKDIIYDTNVILPLSCWVNEFGCYMSVLCTLGENGITKTLPLDLTDKERYCFQNCSNSIWHSLKWLGFEREGYGAIGEKKGMEAPTTGMAPGGGLTTETSVTGTSLDLGKGPEIGGGLGTDIGGFGKTSFEPLKESELATPTDFGTTLGKTDIRGIDLSKKPETDVSSGVVGDLARKPELGGTTGLGRDLDKGDWESKKTTELAGTTDLTETKSSDLSIGNVLSKPMDLDLGQPGGLGKESTTLDVGKESSTIGGRLGTPGTTELGGVTETTGLGRDVGDITKTPGWDSSFGGGPTVTDTDKSKTDLSKSTTGLGTGLGTDISEGMKKDVGGEFGSEQKRLVTDSSEKTVSESLGRPTRQ